MRSAVVLLLALFGAAWMAPGLGAQEEAQGEMEIDRFEEECAQGAEEEEHGTEGSRLSDHCRPLAEIPGRPRPLLEIGEPFLGTGTLGDGFKIPGGAVWQPALVAFGTLRTALQGGNFRASGVELVEAVTRFDLFGNLYLTQTERVLIGFRPLDEDGQFTGYTLRARPTEFAAEEFNSFENFNITTLFMEGDIAELFPFLDPEDRRGFDVYFGVGRQPVAFQDGLLINDNALDMVGLTRANMKIGSLVNARVTAAFGWGEISRHGGGGNIEDENAKLFGMFWEIDRRKATWEVDAVYVSGDDVTGDGIYVGFGDIRRIGKYNNALRVLASFPTGDETAFNQQGVLIHNQLSWTPYHNHNLWYVNTFAGINHFRSAARGPSNGGPVGTLGILFAAPGIGRLGAPLGNQVDQSVGGAVGYQAFLADTRQQVVLEVGGRYRLSDEALNTNSVGGGLRYQAAMGRRFVFQVDGFGIWDNDFEEVNFGGRTELLLRF
ncbi:MAG: hypothetical protein HKO53_18100 [Gemmatimonadetes bacterium]|nr:hypothetical protein [Gemmatimonadota bacterium]